MFIIPKDKVTYLKKNGLYDYLLDMEEMGKINDDDKDFIYQYILSSAILHMTDEEHAEFVDGLVKNLKVKKEFEIEEVKINEISNS